jgi:outer membrane protein OmpA-like peptidoglycan-associated protein
MSWVFALAILALTPVALVAQDYSTSPSRWDIFLGYSYIAPFGTVQTPIPSGTLSTNYAPVNLGAIASISYYFNKNFGLQFEGDEHILNPETSGPSTASQPNNDFSGGSGGVIARWPGDHLTPFVHALGGGERVGSYLQTDTWGWVVTAGGGLDWELGHHFAIRLVQADYQYIKVNFAADEGGSIGINAVRASAGIVFHAGSLAPPPPVTLACSANPSWVYSGDPITVTATAGNLNPKRTVVYSWAGNGVTGSGTTATVATGSLAPGSYEVKATVVEGKGDKPYETAYCTASFTVKAFEPPTVSCSASPSTIKPGDPSTITAVGQSPQNRPLTYSYSADSGTVSGTDTTATYNSTGAPVGSVTVNCNVADDKGGTATASTVVTIQAPYVAPVPHAQALCSITFEKDPKRPERVDNDAKACLDEVALDLQKETDATVVVVGDSTAAEKAPKGKHARGEDFAAQRAVNTKDYLVTEKGIDASRITVKTGGEDAQEVQNYLVPSGADFASEVPGTTAVDESAVKPQTRKALPTRPEPKHEAETPPAAQ